MARHIISCTLSEKSLKKAINQLKQYQKDLERKNQIFVERLGEIGIDVVNNVMKTIPGEEKGRFDTELIINHKNKVAGVTVRLSGDKVLFIEFSAGVTYGTQYYPLPSGDEYGAGTYPSDKHNWSKLYGWWYKDENGDVHHTYGNRAYMPMYHAEQAIILEIRRIAKEVFGG